MITCRDGPYYATINETSHHGSCCFGNTQGRAIATNNIRRHVDEMYHLEDNMDHAYATVSYRIAEAENHDSEEENQYDGLCKTTQFKEDVSHIYVSVSRSKPDKYHTWEMIKKKEYQPRRHSY